jgi:signal transduction histidine kinase
MRAISSLTNRIFVALVLLATLSLGFAFLFAYRRASDDAARALTDGVVEAATIVDQYRARETGTFTRMARLVADLPKLKATVETYDPPTVQRLAVEYLGQIDADLLVLHDPGGAVLANAGITLSDPLPAAAAASLDEESTFIAHPRGVLQVVSVPILPALPEPVGVLGRLTVGFLMDDELAAQFRGLTGSEIAFAAGGRILASSLPAAVRGPMATLLGSAGTTEIELAGDDYLALARPMAPPGTNNAAAAGPATPVTLTPVTLTLRSRAGQRRVLTTLRAGLIGALAGTLVLATILSWGVATTMTRPLAAVTSAMRHVAATGDLTRRVTVHSGTWDDADARLLASAFNTLTESIGRFQRESAQKERLTSLGRLSTVIAHEIRNPLMIIRASLSTLHERDATSDERREAVADIDGESRRINQIVTEVLDFAKPIRFELADTSLNDVCRESAAAAWADQHTAHSDASAGASRPELDLDEALPAVRTDAERLRTALVNLLTNARHAVEKAGHAEQTPVTLGTARRGDQIVITVRDRGTGITPEDMAHIFDPYFTTKRAGTGIGLPITKNIVEGLGGTLSVTSEPGAGTVFRIDLPSGVGPVLRTGHIER